ncbi:MULTISPECIES: polymer-forming cytoskeletal protein [unclassified Luteimonas]|uniref:bactofilin family protein n=1 Tax=unclassified Luteimonas TaxID=2629088 RepID=UPI0016004BB9|nr:MULTISPECIES: polymer-forming cytoskeletal protein [unclassified Luteimonas]MBB1471636.1 polymer-forming cytoskeletal protein [Luteimonas sp. MC1782]MBB6599626.1 polymer-forming cytoskeletal protein [Luteimonas sp. MC1825]QOC87317.1 polymer-forming cytoskeletal protein [Luteimonas sp. MC1825]
MAIFNPQGSAKKDTSLPFGNNTATSHLDTPVREPAPAIADFTPVQTPTPTPRVPAQPQLKESLIAADLTIEGKISGSGHVRIAGKFKGDVNVEGDLTIETGAKLNGGVRAQRVTVAGELEGNIESASRVELQASSVLMGDVKAGTLTVAAGARIRGNVECGWGDDAPGKDDKGKKDASKAGLDLVS